MKIIVFSSDHRNAKCSYCDVQLFVKVAKTQISAKLPVYVQHASQLHAVISAQAKEQSQFASISHKRDVNSYLPKAAPFFVQPYKPGRHLNAGELLCAFHQAECCAHFSPRDQADEATGGLFKQTTHLFAALL